MSTLFSIDSLKVVHKQKVLLQTKQLALPSKHMIAIIGANGAGKSTLINALLEQNGRCHVTGNISHQSQPVSKLIRRGQVAWVGQHEKYEVPLTVLDYCLLGVMPNLAWYEKPSKQAIAEAKNYLNDFDLLDLASMRVQTLSGGEKQRMTMVRALMQKTDILLLDEPTNHLDVKHQRKLFAYLKKLVKFGNKSIVMVLHSLTDAYNYADHIIAMADGKIIATGTPDAVMTPATLKKMYEVDIKVYDTEDGKVFV